jgi:hypothetical protein
VRTLLVVRPTAALNSDDHGSVACTRSPTNLGRSITGCGYGWALQLRSRTCESNGDRDQRGAGNHTEDDFVRQQYDDNGDRDADAGKRGNYDAAGLLVCASHCRFSFGRCADPSPARLPAG